jgi:putative DNA primase/helicase
MKLETELPGILAWVVRGAMNWYTGGLRVPEPGACASADYRKNEDVLGTFLTDACAVGDGFEVTGGRLYQAH